MCWRRMVTMCTSLLSQYAPVLQLTMENMLVALIYVDRATCHLPLTEKNWRRAFLAAIRIAAKVWDDQCVYPARVAAAVFIEKHSA